MEALSARAILSGDLGQAVIDVWRTFAVHALDCQSCADVAAELGLVPDDPYPLYDACCGAGQALFGPWFDARTTLVDRLLELTAPWGMAGRVGEDADRRASALTALPAAGARDIFEDQDPERREAKIRAVIAAHESSAPPPPVEERLCAGCGVRFAPEFPRQRYHDASCRKRADDRRHPDRQATARERPKLFGTED